MLLPVWPIKYLTARFVVMFSLRNILDQRCMALCLAPLLGDNYCGVSSYLLHTSSSRFFFSFSTHCVFALVMRARECDKLRLCVRFRWVRSCTVIQLWESLFCRFLSCIWFFTGRLNAAVDQFSGSDEGMGEMGDNACVECLAMKCVGAEHRQWRAPFHYL